MAAKLYWSWILLTLPSLVSLRHWRHELRLRLCAAQALNRFAVSLGGSRVITTRKELHTVLLMSRGNLSPRGDLVSWLLFKRAGAHLQFYSN